MEQGLQKLVDTVNDNLTVLVARLEATIDASNQYRIYTDLEKDMTGSVKFIYRTESIDAPTQ